MVPIKTNVSSVLHETNRDALRAAFLEGQGLANAMLTLLPADASVRRYFRLSSMLLMDAPPSHENTKSFHAMAQFLKDAGLNVPDVYAADHENGFLLIEDFGELTFRKALDQGTPEAVLYGEVIDGLVHLHRAVGERVVPFVLSVGPRGTEVEGQKGKYSPFDSGATHLRSGRTAPPIPSLPSYSLDLFLTETELFIDWYSLPLSCQAKEDFRGLWREAYQSQPTIPQSIVMRDVMVDNLLWIPDQTGFKRCGFIDFQDGVWGPITYDLVSLLEDARRDISPKFGQEMAKRYLKAFPGLDEQDFWTSYNLWGAQRCTKILGIFSRLSKRDNKPQYLAHLPRVKKILERDLEHPSLKALQQWFQKNCHAELVSASKKIPKNPREGGDQDDNFKAPRIKTGMILAAGLGTRMRPLTDTLPKPLITVAGKSMLERAFEHLKAAEVSNIVVNAHYLAPLIEERVKATHPQALISHEDILLETGGGVTKALPLLGDDPFFVLNGDSIWTGKPSLTHMNAKWDEGQMDALLLLIPREDAHGYVGRGDFHMDPQGRLRRPEKGQEAPYVYIGAQILNPPLFNHAPSGPFSLNLLWDKALVSGRLFGYVHEGKWYHVSTPEDLEAIEG